VSHHDARATPRRFVALTVVVARLAGLASRLLRRGHGRTLPGVVAERLQPGIAATLANQLPHGVVLITGTNGKTSTTRLVAAGLTAAGMSVVTNSSGSNLRQGVVSALVTGCNLRGRVRGDVGVFEVDEATLPLISTTIGPRLIVVLNLFRDQLDRFQELDEVAAVIRRGIEATDASVLLNADDPLVSHLVRSRGARTVEFFGIEESAGLGSRERPTEGESDRCPRCGRQMDYSHMFYAQLGHYSCPAGDYARPAPTVMLTRVASGGGGAVRFVVTHGDQRHVAASNIPGTYNLYNSLAAIATCHQLGVPVARAATAMASCPPAFGRSELIDVGGRTVTLVLVKNPAGYGQVIRTFLAGDPRSSVLLALNDRPADGRDVSWIWDAPLEELSGRSGAVVASGTRARELALRLRYAGVDADVRSTPSSAVDALLGRTAVGGRCYALATYTAMLELRRVLREHGTRERVRRVAA
jgi:lipid II isoglutaminyl synthase (glutamine-hydrolysing)